MVHLCWGEESGFRWQAEAVRGKGDRLYQSLLMMVHLLVLGLRWKAETVRGNGDHLYCLAGRAGPQMASRGR